MRTQFKLSHHFIHLFLVTALTLMACGPDGAFASLPPYQGEPPKMDLDASKRAKLDRGESIDEQTPNEGGTGGRGVKIFRVNASPTVVWSVIKNFPKYKEWVNHVNNTEYYKPQAGNDIFVKFTLSAFGTWIYHIAHSCPAITSGWCTWRLDKTAGLRNDLDDSVGFWRVVEVPGTGGKASYVTYSVAIEVSGFVRIIRPILEKQGLKDATEWVKKQAELRMAEELQEPENKNTADTQNLESRVITKS